MIASPRGQGWSKFRGSSSAVHGPCQADESAFESEGNDNEKHAEIDGRARPDSPAGSRRPHWRRRPNVTIYTVARERPAWAVQAGDRGRGAGVRSRVGARLHRRHHGALPRREGQSARRHGAGPRRHRAAAVREAGPARDLQAERRRYAQAGVPGRSGAYTWTGMDAYLGVICFNTAEGRKAGVKPPTVVEGPADARLQGQARDAASGFVRHRLSDGRAPGSR